MSTNNSLFEGAKLAFGFSMISLIKLGLVNVKSDFFKSTTP